MVTWNNVLTEGATNRVSFIENNLLATAAPLPVISPDSEFVSVWTDVAKATRAWYWEIEIFESSPSVPAFISAGIARQGDLFSPPILGFYENGDIKENGTAYRSFDGKLFAEGVLFGPIFGSGNNILSFLMDLDNHTLEVRVNNSTNIIMSTNLAGFTAYYPYLAIQHGQARAKFGSTGFNFQVPAGFDPYDAEIGSASTIEFADVNITDSGSPEEFEKSSGLGPVTSVDKGINTYRLNYRKLNGNLEESVLMNDNDVKAQVEITPEDKSSGRLKG